MKLILAQAVGQEAPVRLEAPDTVELFAHRQTGKQHLIVNLVNCVGGVSRSVGGFISADGKKMPARFDDIESMPHLYEIKLIFKNEVGRRIKSVYLAPHRKPLQVTPLGEDSVVTLKDVGVHAMVVAEY